MSEIETADAAPAQDHVDTAPLRAIFDRYHAAWEAKDPSRIAAMHSADSSFVLHGNGERVFGRDSLEKHYAGIFETYPGYRSHVARLLLGDDHWVLEWTMEIDVPDAEGGTRTARVDLVDVVDVDQNGLVSRKDVWVDAAQQASAFAGTAGS